MEAQLSSATLKYRHERGDPRVERQHAQMRRRYAVRTADAGRIRPSGSMGTPPPCSKSRACDQMDQQSNRVAQQEGRTDDAQVDQRQLAGARR